MQNEINMPPMSLLDVFTHKPLKRFWLALAILAALYIGYQSLIPSSQQANIPHFDKLMHFTAYFGLGVLFSLGSQRIRPNQIIIALIAYGVTIEILQQIMNLGRSGSWLGALANSLGAIFGTALAMWWIKRRITS